MNVIDMSAKDIGKFLGFIQVKLRLSKSEKIPNVALVLVHRLGGWPNIKTTLVKRFVLPGFDL